MKLRYFLLSLILTTTLSFSKAQTIDWAPDVKMGGQLYPSYILAHAGAEPSEDDTLEVDGKPLYVFNEDGTNQLLVALDLPSRGEVKIELQPSKINEYSVYQAQLDKGLYAIYPKVNYLYDALRTQTQPTPLNLIFSLSVNGRKVGQKTVTVSLRSIAECPYYQVFSEREIAEDMHYMFGAYVNEDHPAVDKLLQEALQTGIVKSFNKYSGGSQNVIKQVAAIWTAMAHRGIQYSSITTTSNVNAKIRSQRIRGFEDVMNNQQANCVDGSVFMSSVLKQIGLNPFLVLIPGHCYLGVYLDKQKKEPFLLETTMIGRANVANLPLGSDEANQKAITVFEKANEYATNAFNKTVDKFNDEANLEYELVDIEEIRKSIKPVGR